jgi:hypothetical protein
VDKNYILSFRPSGRNLYGILIQKISQSRTPSSEGMPMAEMTFIFLKTKEDYK